MSKSILNSVKIVGAGLIGTSIGLALRSNNPNIQIVMQDLDQNSQALAQSLVDHEQSNNLLKGKEDRTPQKFDLVVIAVPINANVSTVVENLKSNPESIVVDLASVKSNLLTEVEKLSETRSNFISLHPMAGREVGGAHSARADLFINRAWIGIAAAYASDRAKAIATDFVSICGGTLYWRDSKSHDEIVALLSHLPQLLSSSMASTLEASSDQDLLLSGGGLTDLTRLANSDSKLWSQILTQNSKFVSEKLEILIKNLMKFQAALALKKQDEIENFLSHGKVQRLRIPGKHGAKARAYLNLHIVIKDEPGQLAKIIQECADGNINIEDISIEHSPDQSTGLVTISVLERSEMARNEILENFKKHGWQVYFESAKER
jgi:prephenate dehydrogenase